MYCRNCGKEISDGVRYCAYCGAAQNTLEMQDKGKTGGKRVVLGLVIIAAVAIVGVSILIGKTADGQSGAQKKEQSYVQEAEPATTEKTQNPDNGWYEKDGKVYYYSDGQMLTDLQEIDNNLYYFYEDGSMAVNTQVDYESVVLEADREGRVTGVTFQNVFGTWSSEKYGFGNNGTSSILDLAIEVENCDRMTLYIEAEGQRGANVSGRWKFYIRSNGKWVHVQDLDYSEPSSYFDIVFDEPMDFDAITAYPTKQGNASYSTVYYLCDVHMGF